MIFVDVETTGLDPEIHQLLELCLISPSAMLHLHVKHDHYTFDPEVIRIFGTRIPENGVSLQYAGEYIRRFFLRETANNQGNPVAVCGKNIAKLDLPFLMTAYPGLYDQVHHAAIDIGNLYMVPTDVKAPSMGKVMSRCSKLSLTHKNDHTAIGDALLTQELYDHWFKTYPNHIN